MGVVEIVAGTRLSDGTHAPLPDLKDLRTLPEVLRFRAEFQPTAVAFIHLLDGEFEEAKVTYRALYLDALIIASLLTDASARGKRVLLLFHPGFEYISALFGVFLSGAVAVPSFPPVGSRALERLSKIVASAQPHLILTHSRFSKLRDRVLCHLSGATQSQWIETDIEVPSRKAKDASDDAGWPLSSQLPPCDPASLALLQYTSGSTSDPKGVMLTHANLISNCEALNGWLGDRSPRVGCTWLPPYHDMGLMGGILFPIYAGFTTVILSPGLFVQRPYRWLSALSRYRVTITVAPNFALDLCVDGVSDAEMESLDLSDVREVCCGAEPIRAKSLKRFVQRFSAVGFHLDRIHPCYGLAEATLLVSGKAEGTAPRFLEADPSDLARGRFFPTAPKDGVSMTLVGSGVPVPYHAVRIVDPKDNIVLKEGWIGEVRVSGGNVAQGYWQMPELSQHTFESEVAGETGQFLRTGDLGFLWEGEIYITGRLKDLIIVSGRNLYPQDIEQVAEEADPRIRTHGVAAFSVDTGDKEEIALVVEIRRGENLSPADLAQVKTRIIERVTASFGVAPKHIHFAPPATIPITTSGKVQRHAAQRAFLDNTLSVYRSKSPVLTL